MSSIRYTTDELVEIVRDYAYDHYDKGAWDVVVEALSDEEIRGLIGRSHSRQGAIRKVSQWLAPIHSHRSEYL